MKQCVGREGGKGSDKLGTPADVLVPKCLPYLSIQASWSSSELPQFTMPAFLGKLTSVVLLKVLDCDLY